MKNLFLFYFTAFTLSLFGQTDNVSDRESMALLAYNTDNITLWQNLIESIESDSENGNRDESNLNLAYAYYGLTGTCISKRNKKLGLESSKKGIEIANELTTIDQYAAQAHALLGGFYGLQIALNPMKGMTLGPKSDKEVNEAMELDPNEPFAYLQKGSSLYNTPVMFGGSVEKSIDYFIKAAELYDVQGKSKSPQKVESLLWLGQAYQKTGDKLKANNAFSEVLAIAPNNLWAKYLKDNL